MSFPNRAIQLGLGNSSSLSTNNVRDSPLQWRCTVSSEKSAPWNAVLSRCRVQQKLFTSIAKHLSSPHLNHQLSHLGTNPSTKNGVSKALINSLKLQITHNSVPTHGKIRSEGKNQVTSINRNPNFNAISSSMPIPSTVIIYTGLLFLTHFSPKDHKLTWPKLRNCIKEVVVDDRCCIIYWLPPYRWGGWRRDEKLFCRLWWCQMKLVSICLRGLNL